VPAAVALSALAPRAVIPLLMIGGAYLCYEGFEKLAHKFLRGKADDDAHRLELTKALLRPGVDLLAVEKQKVKGAVRTDFVLSAEIIAITLGTVATAAFVTRVVVLAGVGFLMTVGVYGLVAGIVKLDDVGLHLSRRAGRGALVRLQRGIGAGLLRAAPFLMQFLSVAGTAAMFLVGGGILAHGIPAVRHWTEGLAAVARLPLNVLLGVVAGGLTLALVSAAGRLRSLARARA
jgi:hypothetical protein